MRVLGLTTGIHDSSASLVVDGAVIAASAEERFDRMKHSGVFPRNAIRFCLDTGNIKDINDIDSIAIGMDWIELKKGRLDMIKKYVGDDQEVRTQAERYHERVFSGVLDYGKILKEEFGYKGKIHIFDHHDCHASVCYFPSSFSSAAILVLDGAGERASTRIYKAQGKKFERLLQIDYPNSIGRFYGWLTAYLGFKIDSDEGKVMGLAPYGDDSFVEKMRNVLHIEENGTYELDLSYFDLMKEGNRGVSEKFVKVFGPARGKNEPLTQRHRNIARAAQAILEEAVVSMVKLAKNLTGEKYLCLGGGVALNSVANGKIVSSGIFDNVFIYPASGDDGTGLGAALYAYYSQQTDKIFHIENQNPYLGYQASKEEILKAIQEHGLSFEQPDNICNVTAELLANNNVVGWFFGRAEFGPRALGNRSILADPRDGNNKDRVNLKVKQRESFRPFAPSVMEEYAHEYFEMNGVQSPYMIMAFPVKEDKREIIPAVTHVDGSARIQTVSKQMNGKYWDLLNEFYRLTGVPVLLDTSFNRKGEPIVNTPKEAIEDFLNSDLDALVLEDYLLKKHF